MASVIDTVYGMLTQYPSLFTNKADCFDHLFMTNGNGYKWIKGELASLDTGKNKPDFKDENEEIKKRKEESSIDFDFSWEWVRLDVRRNNVRIQFAIDNIDLIMDEHLMFNGIHYSGRDYNKLMTIPEDITKDWEKAVVECIYGLTAYVHQELQFDRNLKELAQDLQRFKEERFPEIIKQNKDMQKQLKEMLKNSP